MDLIDEAIRINFQKKGNGFCLAEKFIARWSSTNDGTGFESRLKEALMWHKHLLLNELL